MFINYKIYIFLIITRLMVAVVVVGVLDVELGGRSDHPLLEEEQIDLEFEDSSFFEEALDFEEDFQEAFPLVVNHMDLV